MRSDRQCSLTSALLLCLGSDTAVGFESGLRMSMPPLKNAPSSMLMRAAATSPVSAPSARMSTRSVALTLPLSLPSTTISRALMLARDIAVFAYRDAIAGNADAAFDLAIDEQRFGSGNLALDGEALADAGLLADGGCGRGAGSQCGLQWHGCTGVGRTGSGVGVGEVDWPCWVGFHIALNAISFSVLTGLRVPRQGPLWWTRRSKIAERGTLLRGSTCVRSMMISPARAYQAWLLPLL